VFVGTGHSCGGGYITKIYSHQGVQQPVEPLTTKQFTVSRKTKEMFSKKKKKKTKKTGRRKKFRQTSPKSKVMKYTIRGKTQGVDNKEKQACRYKSGKTPRDKKGGVAGKKKTGCRLPKQKKGGHRHGKTGEARKAGCSHEPTDPIPPLMWVGPNIISDRGRWTWQN